MSTCLCEHVDHFDGGPAHPYGEHRHIYARNTYVGAVCRACFEDHVYLEGGAR